jgi:transposase InsO family protein
MIDSGASGMFISDRFVQEHGIATRKKKDGGYELVAVDGSPLPDVDSETVPLSLAFQQHHEEIVLDVVPSARHDIILGTPWLKRHNPSIDWITRVLRFERCRCVTDIYPRHRQRSALDEKRQLNETQRQSPKTEQRKASPDSTDNNPDPVVSRSEKQGGSNAPPEIPEEFKKWKRLFQEEEGAAALPRRQPWDHEIILQPNAKIPWGPLYPLSPKELEADRAWLKKMEGKGWIRKSKSSFASPAFFVPKKEGELRKVIDFRRLNEVTVKNRYPLPNIERMNDQFTGTQWFSKIDLRDAFYAIRMAEGHEHMTAFRTRYGLYEFLVMPMGLTNAPATCQQMINDVLRDLLDVTVIAYIDDIVIYTKGSREQHAKDVSAVFERLSKTTFKTAPHKCEFFKKEIEFLGFLIGTDGIKIDPKKTTSIVEWPIPKTVKDVQAFLGLANYNRKFVKDYSRIATPLTNLTKKDQQFGWKPEHQQAFDKLKQACCSAPTLAMFDGTKPIQIETDASDRAIGACLTQEREGKRHPIAYFSRKMTPAEQNYEIYDKELLAIVAALRHWRVYCEGAPKLTIYSDHKNLTYFTTTKELTRRQARWSELLGEYKFEITYTPGKENGRADALSRRSDYMEGHTPQSHRILRVNRDGSLSANPQEFNAVLRILRDNDEEFPLEHGKYQVPPDKEQQCIQDHHDDPTHGHPGIAKTVALIRHKFAFPAMRTKVTQYIKKCEPCQRNKASRHAKYGNLQFTPPAEQPWNEVTMDFITGLPESRDGSNDVLYDTILVMVDRLTKYAHFVPCKATISAQKLGFLVLDRLIRYQGLPRKFVTDRDKLFTSGYWQTLVTQMGIDHKLSTAFHPETDGQTERSNQTLETYLRHYVNDNQDNWVSLLPMAQLAINAHVSETTKISPFFANFGREPELQASSLPGPMTDLALKDKQAMTKVIELLRNNISEMQQRVTKARFKDSKTAPQLREGDRVYLLTKNLKTQRPSKKLDAVKVGPFSIKRQKGPVNFELDLPKDARIHPVFHVSLLEPAHPDIPLQETFQFEPEETEEYEVEKILNHKGQRYLVRWKGYDYTSDTWEPKRNLKGCQDLVREYHQKN